MEDLLRRRKAWNALSELWAGYHGKSSDDMHTAISVPDGLTKDEINQYVAKWVSTELGELGYSLDDIKHIFYWEAQPFLNQSHIIQPLSPISFIGIDIQPLEKMFKTKKFCPFYSLLCITIQVLLGWINTAKNRWKLVQEYYD